MPVDPRGVGGGTAAQVDDERALALVQRREHGVGGARAGKARLEDLELGGLGGGARVVDPLRGAVDAERAELEQVAVHAHGRGDRSELVQPVGDGIELELRPFGRQVGLLRAGVDLGDVVLVDESALELPLVAHERGADLRAGDCEAGVADRVAELLVEPLQHRLDRISGLRHFDDLALAHARGRDAAEGRDLEPSVVARLADGDDRARRADLKACNWG